MGRAAPQAQGASAPAPLTPRGEPTPRLASPAARRALAVNLALSAVTSVFFVGALEGWARWREPARHVAADAPRVNTTAFRDRARTPEPPPGVRRVAILGDSVTYGYRLPAEHAYPQQLEALLAARGKRIEVLNAGVAGWSTREERAAYARLRPYRPERVLLAVCLNDLPALQKAAAPPPAWLARWHRRSALVRRLVDAPQREIRSVRQLFLEPDAPATRTAFERFATELSALRDSVRADGASLGVLVFPYRFQVLPHAPAPSVQQRLADVAREAGVPLLDLLPALRELGAGGFVDVCHLTQAGTRRVAEVLLTSTLLELPGAEAARAGGALTPPATRR